MLQIRMHQTAKTAYNFAQSIMLYPRLYAKYNKIFLDSSYICGGCSKSWQKKPRSPGILSIQVFKSGRLAAPDLQRKEENTSSPRRRRCRLLEIQRSGHGRWTIPGYLGGAFTTSANTHFSGESIRRYASNKRLIARDSSSRIAAVSLEPPAVPWTIKGIGPIKCILGWTVVPAPLYACICVPLIYSHLIYVFLFLSQLSLYVPDFSLPLPLRRPLYPFLIRPIACYPSFLSL